MSRARALLAVGAAAAVLSSCAQTVDGTPAATFPTTPAALTRQVTAATTALKTAHLTMQEGLAGRSLDVVADEQLSAGTPTALDLAETIPTFGKVRIVLVDRKTYALVPPAHRTSSKPWVLVRPGSSNPFANAMAQTQSSLGQLSGFNSFSTFVKAARSLRFLGIQPIDGATTGHYALTIDVAKLPDDYRLKPLLQQIGLATVPLEFWMDTDGNVRRATEDLHVAGEHVTTLVTLSDFNAPLHITAPPADQVDTS